MNERQTAILEELKKEKRMSVKKIAGFCHVSEMTVRRDLRVMEADGCLQRYNGGAVYCKSEALLPVSMRKLLHAEEKKQLSARAKAHLRDGMNVFVDASSTCSYMIPILAEYHDIHVVTNSIQNLMLAAEYHIPATIVGGDYSEHEMSAVGSIAEAFLREIHVDVAFLSSLGISDDGVISDNDELQNGVRKIVIANAGKTIFLIDSSKEHRKYLYKLCDAADVAELIVI